MRVSFYYVDKVREFLGLCQQLSVIQPVIFAFNW